MDKIIVKKGADYKWLQIIAKDKESKKKIKEIEEWDNLSKNGKFLDSNKIFNIKLGNHIIYLKESEAWISMLLYTEIFRENDHLLIPEFKGKDAKLIIDLGANIGLYLLKIKEKNPSCKIVAVEPNYEAFKLLKKNVESNNIKEVTLVNKAIVEKEGKIKLKTIREGSAFTGKYLGEIKKEHRKWIKNDRIKSIEVEGITLKNLFSKYDIKKVDILKIDIEGMEFEILKGSEEVLSNINKIVVEWHDYSTKAKIVELLSKNNFKIIHEEPREFGDLYFVKEN